MLRALSVINVADRSGARTAKVRYLLAGTGSHLYAGISDRVGVNIKTIHYFQKKRRITHKRRRGL
jgi:ribosomal protein L14